MSNDLIFSWAEDRTGTLVHVDDVPRGIQCECYCPCCHEKLMARHGEVREHGFAHHSDTRGANLKICYMVTMYKLAEQIISTKKKIHAPSYYGIFPDQDIEFTEVKIDDRYEREDKQPDIVATAVDGSQYLIEFIFDSKVQHKQPIDYKNQSCIEIDLSKQTFESLEKFLLESSEDRKWVNNQNYFDSIVERYLSADKTVRIVTNTECLACKLKFSCCGVRTKKDNTIVFIENSGIKYRICKTEEYAQKMEEQRQRQRDGVQRIRQEPVPQLLYDDQNQQEERSDENTIKRRAEQIRDQMLEEQRIREDREPLYDLNERSCYDCLTNLDWMNKNGYANCGNYTSYHVPKYTPPHYAKTCPFFRRKIK